MSTYKASEQQNDKEMIFIQESMTTVARGQKLNHTIELFSTR